MKLLKLLTYLYIPIFLLGAFLAGLAIVIMTIGQLLMLETERAKKGYKFMMRSTFRGR
ncbi:hypothetical protein ORI89_17335 [Sphingobacterium sp. UT-1RO-CII-1]|uniref:hypothetical protein n=1 Tax=Sphingobacterium sp. UT-1RO-CII-1 TaxID=2995225 RepID=UPI00227C9ECE|nr:hypothetical protein [Sphingobacterium sp. UT-1RO-CII-1]MCY4781426.1 hypothetical protein [Sphingobacterium sp. UT-1RO-CII-1]